MTTAVSPYRDLCVCCCKADLPEADEPFPKNATWRRVAVLKKDEDGEYILNKNGEPTVKYYILHVPSGEMYLDEKLSDIAIKCGMIALGSILYTLGMFFFHAGKIITDICKIAYKTIKETGKQFSEKGACEAIKTLLNGFLWDIPESIIINTVNAVCDPFFGAAMFVSGVIGAVAPLNGRRMICHIESYWHDNATYKMDGRYDSEDSDECCMKIKKKGAIIFLGWCMQMRANLNEDKSLELKKDFN